ncbi:glycosyltransferase family 4 protein [Mucilaginibacter sp. 14171R-50]|uniref:glycosyltransferase n=1 Tax=Mucilaginibacter sp. 14171R-50 TaxID=2703789 RepID=UPI00138DC1A2|nr:glycosyltransferase [Mucilaginibacter sp. 14171R-50]QHS56332.1 glycosyltransferase family 4 protein [Mucilaginibacter sp. 14171R-50]
MNPGIPVPPLLYGGIERIVYLLAEEYHKQGHQVTLLAGTGSHCSGTTITFGADNTKRSKVAGYKEILFVWKFLWRNHQKFDLIHNFGRLIYLLPVINKPAHKIMSYQREVSVKGIKLITSLPAKNLVFTGCSNYCVSTGNVSGKWATVYNAVNFSEYKLTEEFDEHAPLMFLGRLDKIKGLHTAIEVAKATSSKLWIGGNIPATADNYAYYKEIIEPQIDNIQIIYLGELNDRQKDNYLGKAKALLFPIEWDEPFGIVMIEAMACGTPVIGFDRGAVPEVVDEEVTGNVGTTKNQMIEAVGKLSTINRTACREHARDKFNIGRIAKTYLELTANNIGR